MRNKSNRIQVNLKSDGSGFKTHSIWLAEALGAQYSHRRGYHLAPTKHAAFLILDTQGWNASRRYFSSDKKPYTFSLNDGPELSFKDALKQAKSTNSMPAQKDSQAKAPKYAVTQFPGAERYHLVRTNDNDSNKRIIAHFDWESTPIEQRDVLTAVNSHEELTQLLRDVLTAQGNQIQGSHLDRAFKLGVLNSPTK